jgi:hypothetical protein
MTEPTPAADPVAESRHFPKGPNRLTDIIVPKLRTAFEKASAANGDEPIIWEIYPCPAPHPMQPGLIMTGIAIFISIPSAEIGQAFTNTVVADHGLVMAPQDRIDEYARDRIAELLGARRQDAMQTLAAQNGHQESSAPPEGPKSLGGGLYLPGQS